MLLIYHSITTLNVLIKLMQPWWAYETAFKNIKESKITKFWIAVLEKKSDKQKPFLYYLEIYK